MSIHLLEPDLDLKRPDRDADAFDPTSDREGQWLNVETGIYFHGLDEELAKLGNDGYKAYTILRGTSAKVHLADLLTDHLVDAEMAKFRKEVPPQTRLGKIIYLMHPFEHVSFDDWFDVPDTGRRGYEDWYTFYMEPNDLEGFTQRLTAHFEKLALPQTQEVRSLEDAYKRWWGPDGHMGKNTIIQRFIMAKLAGDKAFIQTMATWEFREAYERYEEIHANIQKRLNFESELVKKREMSGVEWATLHRLAHLGNALRFLEEARILDLDIKNPGIDMEPYYFAERKFGGKTIPDLAERKSYKTRGEDWTEEVRKFSSF